MGAVADAFELQAKACDMMGSPFTATVCRTAIRVLDRSTATGGRVLDWQGNPRTDALALRLTGALHALVLSGADLALSQAYPPNPGDAEVFVDVLATAIVRHDPTIALWLDHPPQTNDTARSAVLLPGFLKIARETGLPLALNEVGSSAGLNLLPDKYRYRYGHAEWGDPHFSEIIAPEMRGASPDLSGDLRVASRTGCDLAPLDVHNEDDRLRLRAYIWPDQTQRLARLDAAMAVARRQAFALETADAAAFVGRQLASRRAGQCFVLFHSVVWHYLPARTQGAIASAMNGAGDKATENAPVAWLQMEELGGSATGAVLRLTTWPGGRKRNLALADFHGRWIEWHC